MRGFGSVIGIVVAMFFTAVLVLLYMRTMMPSAPDLEQKASAIDRARDTASSVEAQQKKYAEDLQKQFGE